uniref:FERM domain-containing protein n=1 Tax=Heterorhabditis bacteriophora TaxID=37862 RepID=A0A1I7WST4_HETBA
MNNLRDNFVLKNYTTVNLFLQNPGDLSDPERLNLTTALIEAFEAYPECLGAKFSHYFVSKNDWLKYGAKAPEPGALNSEEDSSCCRERRTMKTQYDEI